MQRDDPVTLIYEVPGIVLTIRGKALEAGAEGDIISVLNIQSKRTVQGTVTGTRPRHRQHGGAAHRRRRPALRAVRDPRPLNAAPPSEHHVEQFVTRSRLSAGPRALRHSRRCVGGCAAIDRLKNIGEQPTLAAIENPTAQPGYKPVQMPMPTPQPASYNPNSLWRNGSRAFFKDQRAQQVGDILTVKVKITDKAQFENETQRSRTNKEDSGVTDFIGSKTIKTPATAILPGRILTADSTASSDGKGSVDRKEALQTNVAAVVTQVLPNGNLVVEGKQEIRVNFEIRELIVAGIVRPEDIQSDNTIDSTKIAQARIAYGGRGQITDVQQPRYGQQVLDVLLPF